MRPKQLFIFIIIFLLSAIMGTHKLLASEYFWQDFSKMYQTEIRVCHDEKATVAVVIPLNYLKMYKEVTLVAVFESNTITEGRNYRGKTFSLFRPHLILNKSAFWGAYPIYVEKANQVVKAEIKLKTKRLKPGENKLTFSYVWRKSMYDDCWYECCGYNISHLQFLETPVRPSSN